MAYGEAVMWEGVKASGRLVEDSAATGRRRKSDNLGVDTSAEQLARSGGIRPNQVSLAFC